MMKQWIISLASGLIGVIIGTLSQMWYTKKFEKNKLIHEYKKFCVIEWTSLTTEVQKLVEYPNPHNNTIFRQSLILKNSLLSFIPVVEKRYSKTIADLQAANMETDRELSLGDFAEEALNKG